MTCGGLTIGLITMFDARAPPLAPSHHGAIVFGSVMSASVKPRLAGRQPSNRGGVPRVMTRLSSHAGYAASAGPP